MEENKTVVVIMAGGQGKRFWPASRIDHPKQYLSLTGKNSLIQETWNRCLNITESKHIFVCATQSQSKLLFEHIPDLLPSNAFLEPEGKNTAACVAFSMLSLIKLGYPKSTAVVVLPADHHIGNLDAFQSCIHNAILASGKTRGLITLGITPTHAHTGYGYIQAENIFCNTHGVYTVTKFIEKPDKAKAEKLLQTGHCYWNSGMFVWRLDTIENAYIKLAPHLWNSLSNNLTSSSIAGAYAKLPSEPVDKAIFEKHENIFVIPSQMNWSDVGSWNAVYDLSSPEQKPHQISSNIPIKSIRADSIFIQTQTLTEVAVIGVDNLIVVESGGKLLICKRDQDQSVKDL